MKLTSNISRPISYNISNPISYPINKVPSYLVQDESIPFDPANISGLRSRLLDANTFTSPINSKYYLKDSSTTNTHLPRQGRCWLFDGVNDYGTRARVTSGALSTLSVFAWVKLVSTTGFTAIVGEYNNGTVNRQWILANNTGKLNVICSVDGTNTGATAKDYSSTTTMSTGIWYHVGFTFSGGTLKLYINGAEATVTKIQDPAIATIYNGVATLNLGAYAAGSTGFISGSARDARIYSSAKDSTAVSAIYNQSRTGSGTFDTTGLLAAYPCNEESGTTGYDISGNGNHLTLTNITQATFHATDTGVLANRNNAEGYRLSGSVYIPKRLTDSLAADGNALTVTGRAAYHGCAETPCVTGENAVSIGLGSKLIGQSGEDFELQLMVYPPASPDSFATVIGQVDSIAWTNGFAVYYNSGWKVFYGTYLSHSVSFSMSSSEWHLLRVRKVGSTLYVSVDFGAESSGSCASSITTSQNTKFVVFSGGVGIIGGRIADFRITTGGVTTYFPLQDGPGSSNTNRNIAWVKSDGTGGVISNAIVNGTVSTIWGNRVPGNVEDWCVKYGGRIAANGAFVAGMLTGGNAADGSAKTLVAGKFGNPFSRLNLNPATAAELNGKNIQTAYEDLPCVTGNGSNVYADIGSVTSALGDFDEIEFWLYANGAGPAVGTNGALKTLCWNGELGAFGSDETITTYNSGNATYIKDVLDSGWNHIKFVWNTSKYDIYLNGTSRTTYQSSVGSHCPKWSSESIRLFVWNGGTSYSSSRVSGLRITSGGVTTYFPLSDGSGADLAWYKSDGTKGVISTALQGTLTNVWANKTDGSKVAATKYALRAIVTRETEFNRVASDGDDRFLIYDNALSGADLSNVEGYVA